MLSGPSEGRQFVRLISKRGRRSKAEVTLDKTAVWGSAEKRLRENKRSTTWRRYEV